MDQKMLLQHIAAILTTALETEPNAFPETMAYMALGHNMHYWERVRAVMVGCKFITVTNHSIALTELGRTKAKELEAALKAAKDAAVKP